MTRVFLSHSSKDKDFYINIVVRNLQKYVTSDNFVYDAITFEKGEETNQEIIKWLEKTDLFVLFLSSTALDSTWVKKEITKAKKLLDNNNIAKLFPIIIDENITHEDERIPKWMKDRYNIRFFSKPAVAARTIHNKLIEVSWIKNPRLKNESTLFVGRNEYIENIESRIDSFEKEIPTALIASGMDYIGRRSILRNGLVKSDIINESYNMPTVILDEHQSIEDFILLLLDLGYGDSKDRFSLINKNQETKVNMIVSMLQEMKTNKEILLIVDRGAIITSHTGMSLWFLKVNQELSSKNNGITLCVVSRHKARFEDLNKCKSLYATHVSQLTDPERSRLLTRYSRVIDLDLDVEDIKFVNSFFSGMPKEIIYTADYIKHNSITNFKRNTNIVSDFTDDQISQVYKKYENDECAKDLLVLVATFDFVSFSLLYEIIDNEEKYSRFIDEFISRGLCEEFGNDGEYLSLNSAVKNYVLRQKNSMNLNFTKKIKKHMEDFVGNYTGKDEKDEKDVSDIFFSLRRAMTDGVEVDLNFLIPSHYLKSMKELYDRRDKDLEVVRLAKRILYNEEFLDPKISHEIRYFLCSALARLKKEEFKEEVQRIKGPDHNFLFGFYYRHVGRDEEAIKSLLEALRVRPKFARAKRELVRVYNNNKEYDKALKLAEDNYNENKTNEYHIHAYFQCLSYVKRDTLSTEQRIMKGADLLEDIKKIDSEKAKSMAKMMEIQYAIYFKDDLCEAEKLVDKYGHLSKKDIFLSLCIFDFYEKKENKIQLKKIIDEMQSKHSNTNSSFYRDYLKCVAIYTAIEGNFQKAEKMIDEINFSVAYKVDLKNKIVKYKNNK